MGKPSPVHGVRFRELRERLGLSLLDVVRKSEGIAQEQANSSYRLSLPELHWFENTGQALTIHHIHCLARIYGLTLSQVLYWYME